MIEWPDFKFPPINLWSMPVQKVDYASNKKDVNARGAGKRRYWILGEPLNMDTNSKPTVRYPSKYTPKP